MFKKIFTLILVLAAITVVGHKYQHYLDNPWTRDGYVRANIIQVTPRVTGPVIAIHVQDNSHVKAGDLLFEIDPRVYQSNLDKAEADLSQAQAALAKAQNEARRQHALSQRTPGSVPELTLNNMDSAVQSAQASVKAAEAARHSAELNLEFTQIYASTDGFVTNFNLVQGAQVVANQPVVALIDEQSFWVEGYFKETDIAQVHQGDHGVITLMSHTDKPFEAEVESIGYGIAQSDGSTGVALLPNVNPNFQWIRLAQRLPVKLKIQSLPDDLQLRVGTSASVMIKTAN